MSASPAKYGAVTDQGAVWHNSDVSREQRWKARTLHGATVWFTGLSGSGKSTIADRTLAALAASGRAAYVLDADNLRHGLNSDLGFTAVDRTENVRRVAEVARVLADAGLVCLVPVISPFAADRAAARRAHHDAGLRFIEVFVDASVQECASRDPKGLYRRALAGELADFTGVSAPYEPPERPDLHLRTGGADLERIVAEVIDAIGSGGHG